MSCNAPYAEDRWDTLVLGIGNLLWADEGFGVRCVEALNARYEFDDSVRVMDGGTQGLFLLPWVRSARRLLIFDAIDFGLPPATLKRILGDNVPSYMGAKKVSMHQAGFQEVLATASLSGAFPEDIALIGVQPLLLDDYGGSLTAAVKEQIEPAVALGCRTLAEWGVPITRRPAALAAEEHIGPTAMDMNDYESGRPGLQGERG